MSYQQSVTIHAPADIVWGTLIDVEHWPAATASINSVQLLDDRPFGVGSRARVNQPKLPTVVWTVTDVQPRREFTWLVRSPGVTTIARHAMAAAGEDAWTVTLSIERRGVLAPVLDALTDKITRTYVDMEAAGLKRVCEAQAQRRLTAAA
jgi:uncharacterized membrane protein